MTMPTGLRPPDVINVFVEVSKDSKNIYKYYDDLGMMVLAAVSNIPYPVNYGFVPNTKHTDGYRLDAFLISSNPIEPGVLVSARPIGVIRLTRKEGVDDKLIAVALPERELAYVKDLKDAPKHRLQEIIDFLQAMGITTYEWLDSQKAIQVVVNAIELAGRAKGKEW